MSHGAKSMERRADGKEKVDFGIGIADFGILPIGLSTNQHPCLTLSSFKVMILSR